MEVVGITGGTGFVGGYVSRLLAARGDEVVVFTRNPRDHKQGDRVSYALWDAAKGVCDKAALARLTGMVHLAGAGVADKRWTKERKREIRDSRVAATSFIVEQLRQYSPGCATFVAASAIGFYGPDITGMKSFTEEASAYTDFLAGTCVEWERESQKADEFARTVVLRFGVVLGAESGAYPQFARPLKFGVMPILGQGTQVTSWIEVEDLARMILYCLDDAKINGIYNAVAPHPATNREIMEAIHQAKGGVAIPVPVPTFLLRLGLGEMSTEILKSCTVSAKRIVNAGFVFRYPEAVGAIKHITKGGKC